jgi:preprotein translocase SecE subunit
MSEENKIVTEVESGAEVVSETKTKKQADKDKKPNFFVRFGKKIAKLCKDMAGELKKVTWTPKAEVFKSFKLVIATVVAVGLAIAVVDVASSWIINSIAGLIG